MKLLASLRQNKAAPRYSEGFDKRPSFHISLAFLSIVQGVMSYHIFSLPYRL